jgi:hypothetical protein
MAPLHVTALFPHADILATHAPGSEPSYGSLQASITQLNANAASVPSPGGDGLLGHLVLTLGDTAYTAISAGQVPHPAPAAPPAAPVFAAGATAAVIADARQQLIDDKNIFATYYATDAALKQQLLAATDERFVLSLKHRSHGFALVRTRAIITHLFATYGAITADDLLANDARMRTPWDPTTPIELLFAQIDDGAAFATDGHDPFTDTQVVRLAYSNVEASGKLFLACRDWRATPRATQTWAAFQPFFKAAHLDLRLTTTASSAGFDGRANFSVDSSLPSAASGGRDDAALQAYFANLAEAQVANNASVSALTSTVAQLKLQVETATTALAVSQEALRLRSPPAAAGRTRAPRTPRAAPPDGPAPGSNYCWTHGAYVAASHTSATCLAPSEGHQASATRTNRQGGSTRGCV